MNLPQGTKPWMSMTEPEIVKECGLDARKWAEAFMANIHERAWTVETASSWFASAIESTIDKLRDTATGDYLMSADNPTGAALEDLAIQLIVELHAKTLKIRGDTRIQAQTVAGNNIKIMAYLQRIVELQHESMTTLARMSPDPGPLGKPRIGVGSGKENKGVTGETQSEEIQPFRLNQL